MSPVPSMILSNTFSSMLGDMMLSRFRFDVLLVTSTGVVGTSKVALFGLLPSLVPLLCPGCTHEEVVIILPHTNREQVREAVKRLEENQDIEQIIRILSWLDVTNFIDEDIGAEKFASINQFSEEPVESNKNTKDEQLDGKGSGKSFEYKDNIGNERLFLTSTMGKKKDTVR